MVNEVPGTENPSDLGTKILNTGEIVEVGRHESGSCAGNMRRKDMFNNYVFENYVASHGAKYECEEF